MFPLILLGLQFFVLTGSAKVNPLEHGISYGRLRTNCTCGRANRDLTRIIGGSNTGVNEWPMMAGVVARKFNGKKNVLQCGGSILTHRHILTAAHCVYQCKPKDMGVILGVHNRTNLNYDDPDVMRPPERFILHPEYNAYDAYMRFDVAIILLPYIEFSAIIEPICLPTERFDVFKKKFTVIGWGYIEPFGPQSNVLKETTLIGKKPKACFHFGQPKEKGTKPSLYTKEYKEKDYHQICTFRNNTLVCTTDSGGPVMWVDPDTNRYVQIGAVSYGYGPCLNMGDVSSDVSYFEPWIQQVIADTYPEEKTCAKMKSN